MITAQEITAALIENDLRHYINGIEDNEATPGEVVLWPDGKPVYSVEEAIECVEDIKAAQA